MEILPIAFNRNSFGNAEKAVTEASIDVGNDGRLALIATAVVAWGQGPFYQRVFRANPDGTGLREIANLDSRRTGGPVDIAVGPNNDVFVLVLEPQGTTGGGLIFTASKDSGEVTEIVYLCAGNDPKSIDVDPAGNLWFSATNGVYRVPGVAPPPVRYQFESPASGPVSGIDVVRGWAFDERDGETIAKVELHVDGQRLTDIPCCSERADVRDGFPQYPADNTRNSGWGLTFNGATCRVDVVQVRLESTSGVTVFGDARAVQVVKPGELRVRRPIRSLPGASEPARRSSGPERIGCATRTARKSATSRRDSAGSPTRNPSGWWSRRIWLGPLERAIRGPAYGGY